MKDNRFVFHDARGVRWKRFKFLAGTGTFVGLASLGLFVQSLVVSPKIDNPSSLQDLKRQIKSYRGILPASRPSESDKMLSRQLANKTPADFPHALPPFLKTSGIRAAFFAGWDEAAFRSLEAHAGLITHLCPEWLSFTSVEDGIEEDADAGLERIPHSKAFKLMPLLSNLAGSARIPEGVESLAQAGSRQQEAFARKLATHLRKIRATGVVIDWEEIDPGLNPELTEFVCRIADTLKERGLETWLCVTMDAGFAAYDYGRLAPHVDRFVALMHDEHGEGDLPGPLASRDWFEGWAGVLSHCAAPEKWIASLGSYGADWKENVSPGEQISFADVMSRAGNAGVVGVETGAPLFNGNFSYFFEGKAHAVWFLDAASFANQLAAVRACGFGGLVVNRLGLEDPAVWDVLAGEASGAPLPSLIPGGQAIASIGDGEIVSLDPTTFDGHRVFAKDPNGEISCRYEKLPSHPTLFRMGADRKDCVALTFDDGPDPEWTPVILDILKARNVKATFFVIGTEAERHPEIISRIIAEGHELGNHTFTHPNLAEAPESLIRLELNATQRLIESLTGRSTILFRPPYNADSRPSNLQELTPIGIAQSLGYMTILENIDPRDWQKPDKASLLARIKTERPNGNILLLHDGGGDRSVTCGALPDILDYFQERGDRTVLVSDLLGLNRDNLLPPLTKEKNSLESLASGAGFLFLHLFQDFLHGFLVVATILVLIRTALVLVLARLYQPPLVDGSRDDCPPLTVLIPAFNEEKVIGKTIRSLLASDYPARLEILVIDDGSTDSTADRVREIADRKVRLVCQKNAGKATALQHGVNEAENEILIFVDADTQFEKDAIRKLAGPFQNPEIGAVSGHARVGNLRTFLARCQDLEYVCGFNLDRRAYAFWNCITVAPGAISAIRKQAIRAAEGFSCDTLAEDTDLTLSIHRAGYQIAYQRLAVAHTEAPETFSALARQRFRWAYGTLQCIWKHRDMIFNPRFKALGWFSLPGIWFFQVVLVAFSPFVDLLFFQSLLVGNTGDVLPCFLAFLTCDLLLAGAAVAMEGLPLSVALRAIPQHFIYRPLLGYVIWKSLFHAIRGAWVGWGKLHRTASVSLP